MAEVRGVLRSSKGWPGTASANDIGRPTSCTRGFPAVQRRLSTPYGYSTIVSTCSRAIIGHPAFDDDASAVTYFVPRAATLYVLRCRPLFKEPHGEA